MSDLDLEIGILQLCATDAYDTLRENQNMRLDYCKLWYYNPEHTERMMSFKVTIISREDNYPARYPDFKLPKCKCWRQNGKCEYQYKLEKLCVLPRIAEKLGREINYFERRTNERVKKIDFWSDDCGPGADITLEKGYYDSYFGGISTPPIGWRSIVEHLNRLGMELEDKK